MSSAQDVCVKLASVGDNRKLRITTRIAAECKHPGLIFYDVDVDEPTSQWHNTSTGIYGILVLVDEHDIVEFVGTHLVTPEVVHVQNVGLARFARDDGHTLHVRTSEDFGRENF
jgi:hypothetical protein